MFPSIQVCNEYPVGLVKNALYNESREYYDYMPFKEQHARLFMTQKNYNYRKFGKIYYPVPVMSNMLVHIERPN